MKEKYNIKIEEDFNQVLNLEFYQLG